MGIALKGRPINFVAGEFLFRKKIFGHIITKGGCIPKAQFRNDLRTVRAMMRVLGRGGVLGIFPEGTRFTDWHSIGFENGLASIIKKTGAGVVIFRSHGAYMTWPRWSQSSWRRGRITAEFTDERKHNHCYAQCKNKSKDEKTVSRREPVGEKPEREHDGKA